MARVTFRQARAALSRLIEHARAGEEIITVEESRSSGCIRSRIRCRDASLAHSKVSSK